MTTRSVSWLLVLALLLAGCSVVGEGEAWRAADFPPDFQLTFEVVAPATDGDGDGAPDDPLRRPQRYVVEADRTLRAAVGGGSAEQTYPPVTARLSPNTMRRLWTLAGATLDEGRPAAESPDDEPSAELYRWSIWADHRVMRRQVRPASSPAARRLLEELARLAYATP